VKVATNKPLDGHSGPLREDVVVVGGAAGGGVRSQYASDKRVHIFLVLICFGRREVVDVVDRKTVLLIAAQRPHLLKGGAVPSPAILYPRSRKGFIEGRTLRNISCGVFRGMKTL
jgi:hypothetical protein